jgi:hypothetical protein
MLMATPRHINTSVIVARNQKQTHPFGDSHRYCICQSKTLFRSILRFRENILSKSPSARKKKKKGQKVSATTRVSGTTGRGAHFVVPLTRV